MCFTYIHVTFFAVCDIPQASLISNKISSKWYCLHFTRKCICWFFSSFAHSTTRPEVMCSKDAFMVRYYLNKYLWRSSIFYSSCPQRVIMRQWYPKSTGCLKPCARKSFSVTVRNAIPFSEGTSSGWVCNWLKILHNHRYRTSRSEKLSLLRGSQEDFVRVYLFYQTTRTTLYREYLLFDESAIVSAVGGSLGLFLGFSCWQAVAAAIQKAWPAGRKKRLLVNSAVLVKRVWMRIMCTCLELNLAQITNDKSTRGSGRRREEEEE